MPIAAKYFVQQDASADAFATSTGTGDIKTLVPPKNANACEISAKTTNARVTFNGVNPGAGTAPGQVIAAGAQPVLFPFAHTIKFVSEAAANCELNVLWLT